MLIRSAAPRLRPLGGPVLRLRRWHSLAAEARGYVLIGGDAGLGIDLVTSQPLLASSAPSLIMEPDGPALDASAGHLTLPHDAIQNITGPLTIALRGRALGADGGFLHKDGGGSGGTNTPFFMALSLSGIYFVRSNSGYCAWQSGALTDTSRVQTIAISSSEIAPAAPTAYFDGVPASMSVRFTNGGTGTPGTNTNPLRIGEGGGVYSSLVMFSARLWTAEEHAAFDRDPYGLLEEAPLYHFLDAGGPAAHDLTATGIAAGTPAVGTPALGQVHGLAATGVAAGTPELGTPAVGQVHALGASSLATAPELGTPAVGQAHALTASGIAAGAPEVGTPAAGHIHNLAPSAIATAPEVGTPAIGQVHALSADSVTAGAPVLGAPVLAESGHTLAADSIAAGSPALGAPAIGQVHVLAADSIATAPVLGAPSMSGTHDLAADTLAAGAPSLGSPALGQVHALLPVGTVGGEPVLGAAVLGQVHALGGVAIAPAPALGSPAIGQVHALAATGIAAGAAVLGAPTLDRAPTITPATRMLIVASESRTFIVPSESRTFTVPAESRAFTPE